MFLFNRASSYIVVFGSLSTKFICVYLCVCVCIKNRSMSSLEDGRCDSYRFLSFVVRELDLLERHILQQQSH